MQLNPLRLEDDTPLISKQSLGESLPSAWQHHWHTNTAQACLRRKQRRTGLPIFVRSMGEGKFFRPDGYAMTTCTLDTLYTLSLSKARGWHTGAWDWEKFCYIHTYNTQP